MKEENFPSTGFNPLANRAKIAQSALKEFFDGSQFLCVRPGRPSKPHAQNPARCSNARRDFIEAKIRVFNELAESCDQCLFAGLFSLLGACNKSHKSVPSDHQKEAIGCNDLLPEGSPGDVIIEATRAD